MPAESPTDEQLKDLAIKQALAGDTAGARQTASRIGDRNNLRQAWQMILFVAADSRDVQVVKETIVSCPDQRLLYSHSYREVPHSFLKVGDIAGAIEVAKAMGEFGHFGLIGIALHLVKTGDLVEAKDVVFHIHDEGLRTLLMDKLNESDLNSKSSAEPTAT